MDHQPFEQWIFEDQKHSSQQSSLLQEHLNQCQDCTNLKNSWLNIEKELHQPVTMSPAAGFTNRFQARLELRRAEQYQKQIIKSLIMVGSGILITVAAILTWLLITYSTGEIIVRSVALFTDMVQLFFNLRSMMVKFLRNTPSFTPYLIWIMVSGWGTILASIWGLTVWKFSRQGMVQK
jgi:hypothetical protein